MATRGADRGQGVGSAVMQTMLQHARTHFPALLPKLNAQTHALSFYAKSGWTQYGPEFDDAGIPHYAMVLVPNDRQEVEALEATSRADLDPEVAALLSR